MVSELVLLKNGANVIIVPKHTAKIQPFSAKKPEKSNLKQTNKMAESSSSSNQNDLQVQITNMMQKTEGIIIETRRLYQLLAELSDGYEQIRRDPSSFPQVKREAAPLQSLTLPTVVTGGGSEIEAGRLAQHEVSWNRTAAPRHLKTPHQPSTLPPKERDGKARLVCTHCGRRRHSKEQCFKIVGYPEWWQDNYRKPPYTLSGNRCGQVPESMVEAPTERGKEAEGSFRVEREVAENGRGKGSDCNS